MSAISLRIHYGFTASATDAETGVRLLRITDIQNNSVDWASVPCCDAAPSETDPYLLQAGDILIARTGGTIGKSFLVGEVPLRAVFASYLIRVQPSTEFFNGYLKRFFESSLYWKQLQDGSRGTGQPNVNGQTLGLMTVPIPPLAEQHRIVAKVDELMALCDRLGAAQKDRELRRDRLTASSIHHLTNGAAPDELREHARFFINHLPKLTARPEQIKQIRQTILNLALRGQLVPQDPKDEAASYLIGEIATERKRLYAAKMIPKPTQLPPINDSSLPFPTPVGWSWTMLGDLCYQVSDGPHFSPHYVRQGEGVPFLSTRNVRPEGFDLSSLKYISHDDHEIFCRRIRPEKGDIIYTKGGTTGIAKVNDLDFEFGVWVHLAVLRIEKKRLLPRYVELALNSPHCYEQSQRYTQGTSSFDLGLTRMIKITIPLPPLPEQHRIVIKVDELMELCRRLEAQLVDEKSGGRYLLEAVLRQAISSDSQ